MYHIYIYNYIYDINIHLYIYISYIYIYTHITYYIEREREIHIFPYHHSIFLILPKNLPLRCSLIFRVFFPFTANPWPAPQRASRFCSPRKRLRNSRTERGEAMICSAISAACTTWEPCPLRCLSNSGCRWENPMEIMIFQTKRSQELRRCRSFRVKPPCFTMKFWDMKQQHSNSTDWSGLGKSTLHPC